MSNLSLSRVHAVRASEVAVPSSSLESPAFHRPRNNTNLLQHHFEMSNLKPFGAQIAGHGMVDGKIFLKTPDGRILKPVQAPPKGEREISFYKQLLESTDPDDQRISQVVPEFFGVGHATTKNGKVTSEEFLVLSNVMEGFSKPSVVDIKIGERTWGPDASESKRAKESGKYTGTRPTFGFSVSGMLVHCIDDDSKDILRLDKEFGKALKTEDVGSIPKLFFDVDRSKFCKDVTEIVIQKVTSVLEAFECQTKYKIYASSLLIAYDAQAVKDYQEDKITRDDLSNFVNVKVIDFANVYEEQNRETDDNFVSGVRNILQLFTDFLK